MARRMLLVVLVAAFTELPPTQVHHGTAVTTSTVEYSRELRDAMLTLAP